MVENVLKYVNLQMKDMQQSSSKIYTKKAIPSQTLK